MKWGDLSETQFLEGVPWHRLRSHLHGDLVLPADAGYERAKQLELAQFDATCPQAVAYCESPADAATCLAFAQDHELRPAARSGGHSLGGYSTTPGLVIDVSRLNAITVRPDAVTLGPGAQNVDVLDALTPQGLAVVGGGCPTVAAGGFLLGGGLGFLTPSLGMACDALTSARVVLANGRTVTASADSHPDLYWALRGGGGGNFGIVTSYTLGPAPLPTVHLAGLAFGYDHALDMVNGFAQWLADAPRTVGGSCFITLTDAAAGTTPTSMITLVATGTLAEFEAELGLLLSLTGTPASRTAGTMAYRDLLMTVFGCAEWTVPECHREGVTPEGRLPRAQLGLERSRLFGAPTTRDVWARALAVFDAERVAGQLHQLQVGPAGGAVCDLGRTDTAYVHRDSLFTVNFLTWVHEGTVTEEAKAAGQRWVDAGFDAIDRHSNGETHQNWIDPMLGDWEQSYYAENHARLTQVKRTYDPNRVFRFAQGIR